MLRGTLVILFVAIALTLPALAPVDGSSATLAAAGTGTAFDGVADLADDGIPTTPVFTSTVSDGAEPAILADRLGRAILVGDHLGVHRSTDGGATWQSVSIPWIPGNVNTPIVTGGIYDGWVFAQDADGTIYASTTDGPVINVARSQDGGATWDLTASTFLVDASPAIADRPWLAARNSGEVAMIWNDGGSRQSCSYSTDGAFTFTKRTLLSNVAPIGGLPAWDRTGALLFASNGGVGGGARTVYRYSGAPCSGGVTTLGLGPGGEQLSTPVVADAAGFYVPRPSVGNADMHIQGYTGMSAASLKTLVVSPPALKNNAFGTIAMHGGELAVAWYGTATAGDLTDPAFNGQWNVYVARVKDFWSASPTVTVQQITSTPNHVGDLCFDGLGCASGSDRDLLDYFQIAYGGDGSLHVAYGHDGTGSQAEVRYARLAP